MNMKLHLAHVLPLLSAWARAQAPIAAPLNISWDPWTNFSWSQLQHGMCGFSKCYFPVSTLAPPGPNSSAAKGERNAQGRAMGWLIQSQSHHGRPELSDWMKTWELAKDLHTRYGANHLLLGPPRRIALGSSDAALLNAHLWHPVQHRNVSRRYAEGNVLVQPVRSCPPSSCLITKCGEFNKAFALMLPAFLEHVHDKATFMHALEQSVRSVNAMVRATPCLQRDFQVFVRNDGQILHLDLDRCFSTGKPNAAFWTEDCFGNALALINTEMSKSENRSGSSLSPGRRP